METCSSRLRKKMSKACIFLCPWILKGISRVLPVFNFYLFHNPSTSAVLPTNYIPVLRVPDIDRRLIDRFMDYLIENYINSGAKIQIDTKIAMGLVTQPSRKLKILINLKVIKYQVWISS